MVRDGGKTRGVDVGWDSGTWSLNLINAKTAAEHKTIARKDERAIIAIMPLLSPLLCCLFCMSTPRGFIVLPLLPLFVYGPPSIMLTLDGGNGGDGGKPAYVEDPIHFLSEKVMKRVQRSWELTYIYLDSLYTTLHNHQSKNLL